MRAFLQTRLGQLGWRAPLIVLTSASAQAGYHLYQGIAFVAAYAVVFAVLAVYYQRARRVWPVIGVHLIADFQGIDVIELGRWDNALRFITDIHQHFAWTNFQHATFDDAAFAKVAERFRQ